MASNKHAQIRYKVLDDCFSNFRRKFYFDDLMEKCNDALSELYGDKHTGIKTRTLRADISYIRDRAGKAGVEVDVMDDGNGHYYRYSEPDFSIFKRGLGEIAHPDFWKSVTLEKLEKVRIEIRDLVQFINGDILPDTLYHEEPFSEWDLQSFFTTDTAAFVGYIRKLHDVIAA